MTKREFIFQVLPNILLIVLYGELCLSHISPSYENYPGYLKGGGPGPSKVYKCNQVYPGCADCSEIGGGPNQMITCTTCAQGMYKYTTEIEDIDVSYCVETCPVGFYPDFTTMTCQGSEFCAYYFNIDPAGKSCKYSPYEDHACTKELTDGCLECSDKNTCDVCATVGNVGPDCSNKCVLQPPYDYCRKCSSTNNQICEVTAPGFAFKQNPSPPHEFLECPEDCDLCDSATPNICIKCSEGSVRDGGNCIECGDECLKCNVEDQVCTLCAPLRGLNGDDPDGKSCSEDLVADCAEGEYCEYVWTGSTLESKTCHTCPAGCTKCLKADLCTECQSTKYLNLQNGQCIDRETAPSPTKEYYISNLLGDYGKTATGDPNSPFWDLQLALVYAEEYAAQYIITNIVLYLYKDFHYLLGDSSDWEDRNLDHRPSTISTNRNYIITIQPLWCTITVPMTDTSTYCVPDEQYVTLANKRFHVFKFNVPKKLHLKRIIINSVDSSTRNVDWSNGILRTPTISCIYNDVNKEYTGAGCNEGLTWEECQIDHLGNMFDMRLPHNHGLPVPNKLILEDCTISDVRYPIGSLIEMNEQGSEVEIINSEFKRFALCGSIIRYDPSVRTRLSKIEETMNMEYLGDFYSSIYKHIARSFAQFKLADYMSFSGSSCTLGVDCHSISVTNSTFSDLDHRKESLSGSSNRKYKVNRDVVSKYQSSGFFLKEFGGYVKIQNNTMRDIWVPYVGCEEAVSNYTKHIMNTVSGWEAGDYIADTQEDDLINSRDYYFISSPIGIIAPKADVDILENTFLRIGSLRGVIVVRINAETNPTQPIKGQMVTIKDNIFTQNTGYTYANSIYALILTKNVEYWGGCGGLHIEGNTFTHNVGCVGVAGALRVMCTTELPIEQDSALNTHWEDGLYFGLKQNSQPSQNINTYYTNLAQEDVYDFGLTGSALEDRDKRIVRLKNNKYVENLSGGMSGLIDLQGIPYVEITGDNLTNNGFATTEALNTYFIGDGPQVPAFAFTPAITIPSQFNTLIDESTQLTLATKIYSSLLYSSYSQIVGGFITHLSIKNAEFRENFLFDTFCTSQPGDSQEEKDARNNVKVETDRLGQVLFVYGYGSEIEILNSTITNHHGINIPMMLNTLGITSNNPDYLNEYTTPLFQLQKGIILKKFSLTNTIISDNKFHPASFTSLVINAEKTDLDGDKISSGLIFTGVTFNNNSIDNNNGALYNMNGMKLIMDGCTISNMNEGEAINELLQISSSLKGEYANSYSVPVTIRNTVIQDMMFNSGAFSMGSTECIDLNKIVVFQFTNITYKNIAVLESQPLSKASFLISSCPTMEIIVNGGVFSNCTTGAKALFSVKAIHRLTLTDLTFSYIYGFGGIIKLEGSGAILNVLLKNLYATRGISIDHATELANIKTESNPPNFYRPIEIQFVHNVLIDGCTFKNFGYTYDGCLMKIGTGSKNITISNSIFENAFAAKGAGALIDSESTVTFISCNFTNLAAYLASAIYADSNCGIVLNNYNTNYNDGKAVILILGESYLSITGGSIKESSGGGDGTIAIIQSFAASNLIDGVLFENNTATYNTVVLQNVQYTFIKDCNFTNNYVSIETGGVYTPFARVDINNTLFQNSQRYNLEISNSSATNTTDNSTSDATTTTTNSTNTTTIPQFGGFLLLDTDAVIQINDCTFINGHARGGGAITAESDSNITIKNSTFINNTALKGGAIYAMSQEQLHIESSQFIGNNATQYGSDIYLGSGARYKSNENVFTENTFNQTYGGSIYGESSNMLVQNATFINNQYKGNPTWCSAITCDECLYFLVQSSLFQNWTCYDNGAGIYLLEEAKNDQYMVYDHYHIITTSTFLSNIGGMGGGIKISNVAALNITQSNFTGNQANVNGSVGEGKGGGISFGCEKFNCKINLEKNIFNENNASSSGGALYYSHMLPIIENELTFKNNKASLYGDNYALYSQEVRLISEEEFSSLNRTSISRRNIESSSSNSSLYSNRVTGNSSVSMIDQGSGYSLPTLYLVLVDMFGQVVGEDSVSRVQLSTTSDGGTGSYLPSLEGISILYAIRGTYNISNVKYIAEPNSTQGLQLLTNAIDYSIPSNLAFITAYNQLHGLNGTSIDINISVIMRPCLSGEAFSDSGECRLCVAGKEYLVTALTSPSDCLVCPKNCLCLGGDNVGPDSGYWRATKYNFDVLSCYYKDACLGIRAPDYNHLGDCEDGYQGILCTDCRCNYARAGFYQCSNCPNIALNILKIIGLTILFVLIMAFMVRFSILAAKQKRSVTSVYMRILMNHIQLVLLTYSFQLDWPAMISYLLQIPAPVAHLATHFLSVDCFLDRRTSDDDTSARRVFYDKNMLIFFLPIIIVACTMVFWGLIGFIKRMERSTIMELWITTNIVIIFLAQPIIAEYMMDSFHCQSINGTERLKKDLMIKCWEGDHWGLGVTLGIIGLLLWGLGLPLSAMFFLKKNSSQMDNIDFKAKYGFLYNGYKEEKIYWEMFIFLRKISLILMALYLTSAGKVIQGLVIFLAIILFLFISIRSKPFVYPELNNMENLSLLICAVTVYCGLFFTSKDNPEGMKEPTIALWIFFALIVIMNLTFIFYWLYKILQEIRLYCVKFHPKIFLCFFACGNKERMERYKENLLKMEKKDIFKDQLILLTKNMKRGFKKGNLYLNMENMEHISKLFGVQFDYEPEPLELDEIEENIEKLQMDERELQIQELLGNEGIRKIKRAQVMPINEDPIKTEPIKKQKSIDHRRTSLFFNKKEIPKGLEDVEQNISIVTEQSDSFITENNNSALAIDEEKPKEDKKILQEEWGDI